MENWLERTELLLGKENIKKIQNSKIAVFGLGGVGSYVAEALVRSGVGTLMLIDNDIIDITNINRQLLADTSTLGMPKVLVGKKRYLTINPQINIIEHQQFYDEHTHSELFPTNYDYIVDAIDSINSKLLLIEESKKYNIPIISSMGTGNKIDASQFEITDISKTSVCPLAKIIRKKLKEKNITNVKVLYSKEEPIKTINNSIISSISFVPSVAGLLIAGEIIRDLIQKN